jgi:thiamine kinase-like enzyme
VRALPGPLVLCHTDAGGENLLIDGDAIAVLDWDDVVVAPPEHDLQGALDVGLERVLTAYAAAGGALPLHLDHFAFYLLRRYLGDMTVRFLRLLHEQTSEAEDEQLVGGMAMFGIAQWSVLDHTLDRIAAALALIQ